MAKVFNEIRIKVVRDVRMSRMLNRRTLLRLGTLAITGILSTPRRAEANSTVQSTNKSIVARWYAEFWGKTYSPSVIDEVTSSEITLKHSLHRVFSTSYPLICCNAVIQFST
jgi:hypothetical protein